MLADALEARLAEWARWCRDYRRNRSRAGSAEGFYRSPQHWEPITLAPRGPPLAWRAYEVELVVVALLDPFRTCLVLHYVICAPEGMIRRRLRPFHLRDTQPVLIEARRRVGIALERTARPRSQVPSYPHPSRVEIVAPARSCALAAD